MLALLLVIGLFLYLAVVGQAVISLLRPRTRPLWGAFLAPNFGLAAVLIILTRLSVNGIPVEKAGPWLTVGLLVFAAAVWAWRRPRVPWRALAPFGAISLLFVVYVGWPALCFGFKWVSYGNDDMANYCLAAQRFLQHGYYQLPLQTDLEGRDYTQHYWFMHALQQIRPGSELTIAWAASLTGLKCQQVFMPTILMMGLLQLFAMGAVSLWRGRNRRLALVAFFLFATSPLFGLGTLYQLIAQVGGVAILLAAAAVLLSARGLDWRKLALGGLLTAALAIIYPEVSPFLALSLLMYGLHLRYRDNRRFTPYLWFIVGTAVLTFLLLATSTYEFINTLVMQSIGSAGLGAMTEINDQSGGLVLFPWTLVPSFVPMLFGIHIFGWIGIHPLLSLQIFLGFCLLGFFIWRVCRNLADTDPTGYLGIIMVGLGFFLFFKGQDFGLFKLAMWAQPVTTFCLAQGIAPYLFAEGAARRRRARWAMGGFVVCTIPASLYYSIAALGNYGGGLTEVVDASRLGVAFTPPKDIQYGGIESDISNVVSAKMLALYTQGIDTRFLSRSYMDNVANIAVLKFLRTPNPDLGPQAYLVSKLSLLRFLLPPEIMTGDVPDYKVMTVNKVGNSLEEANNWTDNSSRHLDYGDRLYVSILSRLDHFNKANPGTGWTVQGTYQYKLESQVRDRLVFIHSALSPHYYSSARTHAAFFQREPEPITHGRVSFHGTGRYTLFEIVHPSPDLRVMVDFTRTPLGGERSDLPTHAKIIGDDYYHLPFVGYGSARIVSPLISPEKFEQESYIMLDFGEDARPIPTKKPGLMSLWGRAYNLDDRRLVGFTRDVSVLTNEEYLALPRPTRIGDFPGDLSKYPGLEYSGLYEDGWVARDAYFKLGASHPGQVLRFRGYVPDMPIFRTRGVDVTISINDKPTEIVNLKAGDFSLTRLIREAVPITSISLHFSDAQVYVHGDDGRAVSAFVREIAIVDAPDLAAFRRLANGAGSRFQLKGVDNDGWVESAAEFTSPALDSFQVLKVDLEMPGWAPVEADTLRVSLDGKRVETDTMPRATYQSLLLPLQAGGRHVVHLESSAAFPLPNQDRRRSLAIKNISLENVGLTDLFVRGWHRSGYVFGIDRADADGWVDRRLALRFPATSQFKTAVVQLVRFPSPADLPLAVTVDGRPQPERTLGLEAAASIEIPLSADRETAAELVAPRDYPLAAPDTRVRSYRILNIDFK